MTVWIQNPFDNLPCEGYRKQRFWMMSEAFAAAGHRVVFWTSDFSHANKRPRTERIKGPVDGAVGLRMLKTLPYPTNVCWARVRSHRAYAREWMRQAMKADERPDVIVSSIPTVSNAQAAQDLARAFGARVVVDVMDAWPETFERLAPKGLRWTIRLLLWPLRRQAQRIYSTADLVTGVCERYRALTRRADYFCARHGVELTPSAESPVLEPRQADARTIRLAYAGNIGRTYDLDTVLKAVAANPDFTLDIAGKWTRDVPERVTAHGYLGQAELERLLASCDVGIIPMNADSWVGIPYKMCDYAKAGLRIVSSLGGESEGLLRQYGCGVAYRSGDATGFAAAVRAAAGLPPDAARKMVACELDAAGIYRSYVRRVEALCGEGRAGEGNGTA